MEKHGDGRAQRAGEAARSDRASRKTQSYKHVKLERERPQAHQRGFGARPAPRGAQRNAPRQGGAAKKDPRATLKIIPLGGLDAIART